MADTGENDDCGQPCPPDIDCEECVRYWARMRDEGYWKDITGWTDKGLREIIKGAK